MINNTTLKTALEGSTNGIDDFISDLNQKTRLSEEITKTLEDLKNSEIVARFEPLLNSVSSIEYKIVKEILRYTEDSNDINLKTKIIILRLRLKTLSSTDAAFEKLTYLYDYFKDEQNILEAITSTAKFNIFQENFQELTKEAKTRTTPTKVVDPTTKTAFDSTATKWLTEREALLANGPITASQLETISLRNQIYCLDSTNLIPPGASDALINDFGPTIRSLGETSEGSLDVLSEWSTITKDNKLWFCFHYSKFSGWLPPKTS